MKVQITQFEALKDGNSGLSYGVIEKETQINITVGPKDKKLLKI